MNGKTNYNSFDTAFQGLMTRVYSYMFTGLLITALVALYTASNEKLLYAILTNPVLSYGLIILQLGLVMLFSFRINKMSFVEGACCLFTYSLVNGLTLSFIFVLYEIGTIYTAFFSACAMFGAMSVFGYFTKKDLSSMGRILFMALIGLIVGSLINIFIKSEPMDFLITAAGVLIFAGLTAFDTQKIKENLQNAGGYDMETVRKISLHGALRLYLDFINMFLYLLRMMNRNR